MFTGAFLFGSEFEPLDKMTVIEDRLVAGPIELVAIPTPGHSLGSLCYFHEATGSLFSGDVVFCDGGVGRWDLPGGDLEALRRSIDLLAGMPIRGLYPGHGRVERDDPMDELSMAASGLG